MVRAAGVAAIAVGLVGCFVAIAYPNLLTGDSSDCPWLDEGPERIFTQDAAAVAAAHQEFLEANLNALKNAPAKTSEASANTKYTEDELATFDGSDASKPVLVAVGGHVFDVSDAKAFYGESGPYHAFAGRACTRGISLPSLQDEDISDDTGDFTAEQHRKRKDWIDFFLKKYAKVGNLIPDSKEASLARRERMRKQKHREQEIVANQTQRKRETKGEFITLEELGKHDGSNPALPILFSVGGHVLDVTTSSKFYGPGAPRHMYAGRAISRALTLQSAKPEDLNDDVTDFDAKQRAVLKKRIEFFLSKFPKVGTLLEAKDIDWN